jgi:DNA-binding beta-propeller fold protein YncE
MFNSLRQLIEKRQINPSLVICLCIIAIIIGFLFILISFQPTRLNAFDKKDIQYLDMIKNYGDNISFKFPIDVYAAKNGDIYIIDSGPNKIWIFNDNLLPVSTIDKKNGLDYPISIAVDKKGMIFVSEATPDKKQKGSITIFDPIGRKKGTLQFEGFPGFETFVARDMAIDEEGNLYLAGGSSGPLIIMTSDGNFVKSIQPVRKTKAGKEINADVTRVDLKEDLIYLLSEWEGQIYVYNRKGDEVNVFGKKGGSPGKLNRAQGLAVDPRDGIIYVMDYMRHTLLIYDSSGSFMNEFGGEGWGPGWFNYPKDICIDNQGRLFVADAFNKRVQIFKTR